MRIAIDARPLCYPATGIGRYTNELITRFVESDHQFFLYAHKPFSFSHPDVVIRTLNISQSATSSIIAQTLFPKWASEHRIDVFWSPRHHLPLRIKTPTVLTIHDLVWKKSPESMSVGGRLIERLLMPGSLRKADAIIAVSKSTSSDLSSFLPEVTHKTTVIPLASFHSSTYESDHKNFILFVGTLEPRKNLLRLLKAFRGLLDNGTISHKLVLAGGVGWKFDLEETLRSLDLVEKVEHVHPNDETLENLYKNCHFLVLPSLYEGFGLPLIEAMSFGKPVLTSNCSSMPEVAGPAGLYIDPLSITDIQQGMKTLITDTNVHSELSKNATIQTGSFSWDRTANETLKIMESVA